MKDLLKLREEYFLFLACLWEKKPFPEEHHGVITQCLGLSRLGTKPGHSPGAAARQVLSELEDGDTRVKSRWDIAVTLLIDH